jgi:hypothetical protein
MKKTFWILCAVAFVGIVLVPLLSHRDRGPSYPECTRALARTADLVDAHFQRNGKLPSSLAELGGPDVTAFHGVPVQYSPSTTTFILSIDFPAHLSPFRNQKPPQDGDRLESTKITMSFTVTEDTEPSPGGDVQ